MHKKFFVTLFALASIAAASVSTGAMAATKAEIKAWTADCSAKNGDFYSVPDWNKAHPDQQLTGDYYCDEGPALTDPGVVDFKNSCEAGGGQFYIGDDYNKAGLGDPIGKDQVACYNPPTSKHI
jgi:hypothetical protein